MGLEFDLGVLYNTIGASLLICMYTVPWYINNRSMQNSPSRKRVP